MQPALVYRTPLWKEIVALLLAAVVIAVGVLAFYAAYTEGDLMGYVVGFMLLPFGVIGAILSISSNTVLRLDAEGVFVQPHFLKKRRIPWSDIDRFEKSIQTFRDNDRFGVSEHKVAYLGIYLKRPEDVGAIFQAVHAVLGSIDAKNAAEPLIKQQGEGHIFISSLQLPGNIDKLLAEVRAYHTQATGGAAQYDPNEVLPSTKGSYKPSLLAILLGIGVLVFLLLFAATSVTGMNVEQLLDSIF